MTTDSIVVFGRKFDDKCKTGSDDLVFDDVFIAKDETGIGGWSPDTALVFDGDSVEEGEAGNMAFNVASFQEVAAWLDI